MSAAASLLSSPQNPKIFSVLPTSPFSPLPPSRLSLTHHFPFCRKLCSLSFAFPSQHSQAPELVYDEEEEEEYLIGDCLVFEDGIFEDPFLQEEEKLKSSVTSISTPPTQKRKTKSKSTAAAAAAKAPEIEPQNLVPEEWQQIVEEINISKKERRKIAQELEYGQRLEKKKRMRSVNLEGYLKYRNEKLSQLKPVVLDDPTRFPSKIERREVKKNARVECEEGGGVDQNGSLSGDKRVEPRDPRRAVYGRNLDDITYFFNSGNYQPGEGTSEGRPKLFSKEEKVLLNARAPNLAAATSVKWLPLHSLAASGEFYLLNALLKHVSDINATDQDGLTALHKAIICKKQAITNYLLRESANPFVRDKDGATLMHYAVRTASSLAIKTLLLYNIDINLQDNDGWTPLHLAVQARRTDMVKLLLIKGADKSLKNKDGLTPLQLCLYSGRDTRTYELIKLLKQLPKQRL
ncbi:hypothetical protein Ancab_003113 [Ancistrocladus abbreviatus]